MGCWNRKKDRYHNISRNFKEYNLCGFHFGSMCPMYINQSPKHLTWLSKAAILGFCFLINITNDMF